MKQFDIEAIQAEGRALDYVRGTPAEVVMWRVDDEDSRANLAIEGVAVEPGEEALFDMLRDEAVPPVLATQIVLKLLNHPDADPALAITPLQQVGVETTTRFGHIAPSATSRRYRW